MFALVTGSTGFLGSHLVQRLRESGHRVRALVRNRGKASVIEAAGAEIVDGDVTAPASLAAAITGVDVVFHAAANVSNWGPWSDFQAITVQGTENILEAAIRVGVQRFVHISTIRVYDDRYCRTHRAVTEDAPLGARGYRQFGYYAHAKALAEAVVWRHADQLPVTVIRPAWIYGPRDEGIIPPMVRWLRDPKSYWPGRSNPCGDPIFVTDVADCAIAAALHPKAVGQAYNASPHQWIGTRDFQGLLCNVLKIQMPTRTMPYWMALGFARLFEGWATLIRSRTAPAVNRTGLAIVTEDVRHDPAKAERDFGWRSRVELADGVAATARWLRECHPELFV